MEKINSINYDLVDYDSTCGSTRLAILISGKNINYIIVNTIRRTIFTEVPIYAFTDFNIKKNESVFNNNYMKLRLTNFPVWGINNNINFYNSINHTKKLEPIEEIDVNEYEEEEVYSETDNKVNTSSLDQLTMYLDYTSKSSEIITVTTDNAKFYYKGKYIDNPYKVAIPLIKLHPSESINFSAITTIGIEKESAIFSPVSVCFYKQKNENEFEFILESKGQINEKRIIDVALLNIIERLKKTLSKINEIQFEDAVSGEIILENEDNTFGNLLATGLQMHKDIKFAGYNLPHLLENRVKLHYELFDIKKNIKNIFKDIVDHYSELFEGILNKNKKIKLKD
jgi:DNA-directed RNA polymerase subunit L